MDGGQNGIKKCSLGGSAVYRQWVAESAVFAMEPFETNSILPLFSARSDVSQGKARGHSSSPPQSFPKSSAKFSSVSKHVADPTKQTVLVGNIKLNKE